MCVLSRSNHAESRLYMRVLFLGCGSWENSKKSHLLNRSSANPFAPVTLSSSGSSIAAHVRRNHTFSDGDGTLIHIVTL